MEQEAGKTDDDGTYGQRAFGFKDEASEALTDAVSSLTLTDDTTFRVSYFRDET